VAACGARAAAGDAGDRRAARHRAGTTHLMAAYFEGLKSEGYVEAQNVMVEYRWAGGVSDRIPEMMAELVRMGQTIPATSLLRADACSNEAEILLRLH
jgi:hypothetical protein